MAAAASLRPQRTLGTGRRLAAGIKFSWFSIGPVHWCAGMTRCEVQCFVYGYGFTRCESGRPSCAFIC